MRDTSSRLIKTAVVTLLLSTGTFAVANVSANKGNCCGAGGCEVLDDYWIHCESDAFCQSYTPNYPVCCDIPGGFCAMP